MRITIVTIMISLFLFIYLSINSEIDADAMKIAVASSGQSNDALISQQASRAPFFLFFDDQGNLTEIIENPFKNQSHLAGPSTASFFANKGVKLVIAGNFGHKMKQALQENNIQYIEITGVVCNAVQTVIKDN
jgi:predicted Fe-Mo cluster-binding NifX family protein